MYVRSKVFSVLIKYRSLVAMEDRTRIAQNGSIHILYNCPCIFHKLFLSKFSQNFIIHLNIDLTLKVGTSRDALTDFL